MLNMFPHVLGTARGRWKHNLSFPAPECEKMGRCKRKSAMRVIIQSFPESELRKKRKRSRKCVISMGDEHPS